MTPCAAEASATALVVTRKGLGLTALAKTVPEVLETARQHQCETFLAQAVGAEIAACAPPICLPASPSRASTSLSTPRSLSASFRNWARWALCRRRPLSR